VTPAPGTLLAEERAARGLTLDQAAAATRIRAHHLAALEAGRLEDLPGPVYTRGYMRAYADYLGLDGDRLLSELEPGPIPTGPSLSIGGVAPSPPPPGLALTGPVLAGAGLILLALLFGLYAFRQFESLRQDTTATPALIAPPIASLPRLASAAPVAAAPAAPAQPVARYISVVLHTTDQAWIYVEVDGKPFYGPSGRFFDAGGEAIFIGRKVKVTSGKAGATLVTLDGEDVGPLGAGVVTREFAAQN
jgi:transcriptional regulator with XRE-family HTH domain